ncbi:uncharacterized protein LACBIDRAFT_316607 [Laccaria bicolor S238N-H82]|uniref:Predicted protein n=1 Tax=Laccaria bicolor (strain S238N-H82 / ATCC MYA-4686) TaxID=486041 RepID=B0E193_LACBS|nr:uncharacterized protein LACBIDRAFT_316607 [Laccaria bicolor S238N-H82]EDQ99382.1 predicted protein [Laccaria bicolor S238N-H82]|eukprot:XP_001889933.1 predicted protein [Laccaria bicolor S238N-H82]
MTLPSGIYRITQWGSHDQPQVLTLQDELVTVLPPGAAPEKDQEWGVRVREDGLVATVQNPANLFPSRSLSYEGDAERGKRVIPGPFTDFPTRFWRVEPAPQLPLPVPYFIRVPDKDLIAAVSDILIFPPALALETGSFDLKNAWAFELLRPN